MKCEKCGSEVSLEDIFCGNCGNRRFDDYALNVCPECGEKYEEGNEFCGNCGNKIYVTKKENSHNSEPQYIPEETYDEWADTSDGYTECGSINEKSSYPVNSDILNSYEDDCETISNVSRMDSKDILRCSNCGCIAEVNAQFCGECGASLKSMTGCVDKTILSDSRLKMTISEKISKKSSENDNEAGRSFFHKAGDLN